MWEGIVAWSCNELMESTSKTPVIGSSPVTQFYSNPEKVTMVNGVIIFLLKREGLNRELWSFF